MKSLKIRRRFNFKHAESESKCRRSSLHSIVDHGLGKIYVLLAYFCILLCILKTLALTQKYGMYTGHHESYRLKEEGIYKKKTQGFRLQTIHNM
jgi:hypothetical protein